jgi:pyroglutamyl-peptidase
MRILITCFMPFKGRVKNGSQILAHYLQIHHKADEIRVVDIPVRWGAVESLTRSIIEDWQPDIIVGLGEGGSESIAVETIARNIRKGEDVDGASPPGDHIVVNGEAERQSRFSFTWTHHMKLPVPIKISLDAGGYLCNNALFHYCGTGCSRIGFIHVPPQNDVDDTAYSEMYGPVLLEILQQNTIV